MLLFVNDMRCVHGVLRCGRDVFSCAYDVLRCVHDVVRCIRGTLLRFHEVLRCVQDGIPSRIGVTRMHRRTQPFSLGSILWCGASLLFCNQNSALGVVDQLKKRDEPADFCKKKDYNSKKHVRRRVLYI